jgi:hypothetical protein
MLALADNCVHPESQQKYVKSYGGGKDTSPEGLQVYLTTASSVHSEADR